MDQENKIALEQHETEPEEVGETRLAKLRTDEQWRDGITIKEMIKPHSWRLLKARTDGKEPDEEIVFTLTGVIIDKDLPPGGRAVSRNLAPQRYKYLRQSLTIGGFGTLHFREAMRAVSELHQFFDRSFPEGKLEASADSENFDDPKDTFDSANRYFTPKDEAQPGDQHIPFGKQVDPNGILESIAKEGYLHTEDNVVEYFKRKGSAGKYSYEGIGPQAFRIGDIVAIQVTFAVVQLRGGKFKMLSVLRSVTLINESLSKNLPTPAPSQQVASLKRRVRQSTIGVDESGANGKKKSDIPMETD